MYYYNLPDRLAMAAVGAIGMCLILWPILLVYRYVRPRKRVRAWVAFFPLWTCAFPLGGIPTVVAGLCVLGFSSVLEIWFFKGPVEDTKEVSSPRINQEEGVGPDDRSINQSRRIANQSNLLVGNAASLTESQLDQCANWMAHIYAAHSLETYILENKLDRSLLYYVYDVFNEATRDTPNIQLLLSFSSTNSYSYLYYTQEKLISIIAQHFEPGDLASYLADSMPHFARELKAAIRISAESQIVSPKLLQAATNIVQEAFLDEHIQGKEILLTDPYRSAYIAFYFLGNSVTIGDGTRFIYEIYSNVMHPAYALIAAVRFYLTVSGKAAEASINQFAIMAEIAQMDKMFRLFSWGNLEKVESRRMVACTEQDAEIVFGRPSKVSNSKKLKATPTNRNTVSQSEGNNDTWWVFGFIIAMLIVFGALVVFFTT